MAASDGPMEVQERWRKADRLLWEPRRNFLLNTSFHFGHQWVSWDRTNQTVRSTQVDPTTRTRVVMNLIAPRVNNLVGRMVGRPLAFEVEPSSTDDVSRRAAQQNEALLDHLRRMQSWERTRREAILASLLGGSSAVSVDFDPNAGQALYEDPATGRLVHAGDIVLTDHSLTEFTVEPSVADWWDARWWMSARSYPPEVARDLFGLDKTPPTDARAVSSPLESRLWGDRGAERSPKDQTVVYKLYERPNEETPEGRVAIVVGGEFAYDGPWPFPFTDRLNLWVFRQEMIPGRWFGASMVSRARSPQAAYNAVHSNIQEHIKKAGNSRLWAAHGSLDPNQELTDEAGEVQFYYGEFGAPTYAQPPDLSRYQQQYLRELESHIDGVMHAHAASRGQDLGDRASARMISLLQERDDTPLSVWAHDQAEGWSEIGRQVLLMLEAFVRDQRQASVATMTGGQRLVPWSGTSIRGETMVRVPLQATKPVSHAALVAQLEDLKSVFPEAFAGMDQKRLLGMLDTPVGGVFDNIASSDVKLSISENERMSDAEPVMPETWHDHAVHIAEHNDFRNSDRFRMLPDEVQRLVALHIDGHQRLAEEEIVRQFMLNRKLSGMAAVPQGDRPPGSALPAPFSQQQMGASDAA